MLSLHCKYELFALLQIIVNWKMGEIMKLPTDQPVCAGKNEEERLKPFASVGIARGWRAKCWLGLGFSAWKPQQPQKRFCFPHAHKQRQRQHPNHIDDDDNKNGHQKQIHTERWTNVRKKNHPKTFRPNDVQKSANQKSMKTKQTQINEAAAFKTHSQQIVVNLE